MLHQAATDSTLSPTLDGYAEAPPQARSYWQTVRYRLRHDYLTLSFGSVVLLIILSALCAPLLAPADPYQTSMMARLKPFGYKGHILGTDELGRDMLSRLLYGGRVSLTMGMVPVMLATVIGSTLGIVAGYAGKHFNMAMCVVRAQYGPGYIQGEEVPGYRREEGVRHDSTTETYVALKCFIDNWRWAGVPFYLRTGKRLPKRASEVAVFFKPVPQILFNADPSAPLAPNVLTLRIQPNEGFSLRMSSKVPGPKARVYPVLMDFRYGTTFGDTSPEAYERLLLDVMAGDATLFMRRDAVEVSWTWITDILQAWEQRRSRFLPEYPAGSWGPLEADRLIEAEGRAWRIL